MPFNRACKSETLADHTKVPCSFAMVNPEVRNKPQYFQVFADTARVKYLVCHFFSMLFVVNYGDQFLFAKEQKWKIRCRIKNGEYLKDQLTAHQLALVLLRPAKQGISKAIYRILLISSS
ncbi:MAG: hypothetical protein ACLR5Y_06395 [Haemophilus parainfluenzae]